MPTRIRVADRTITLAAHPVGIDVGAIRRALATPEAGERIGALRKRFANTKIILSVERLDYVKGPIQKLRAYESLLERRPDLRGAVKLLFVTTPPAAGMAAYARTREVVDQTVGRINGRFGTLEWNPIVYLYRSIPFDEVLTYYAAADIAWITPLRDGLNLVAKEYVVAKDVSGGDGVLVLSEFAGAAVELHGAILANPYDVEGLRDSLVTALALPEAERRQQLRRLVDIVERRDVAVWSEDVLAALAPTETPPPDSARGPVIAA
jgi:trehalose-6-phosphate synthase